MERKAEKFYEAVIDVTKIDKTKLFKGNIGDGLYLPIKIIVLKEPDKNGKSLYMVVENTKEERLAGKEEAFLGRGKLIDMTPRAVEQQELDNLPW